MPWFQLTDDLTMNFEGFFASNGLNCGWQGRKGREGRDGSKSQHNIAFRLRFEEF